MGSPPTQLAPALPLGRVSMTPREVCRSTGASMKLVRRLLQSNELRSRRIGARVFVDPESVQQVFGFEPEGSRPAESTRVLEMAKRILGSEV